MVQLPFSAHEFFAVFGRYNTAVGSWQWVLYGLAAVIVAEVVQRRRPRLVVTLLATFWIWMAVVYHFGFFADINPAARASGAGFLIEAVVLVSFARTRRAGAAVMPPRPATIIGRVLVAYALIGYPLVGYLAGQRYPEMPLFGAPCPTTIFTIGILAWTFAELPWWVMAIPAAWAVVATSAALQLGVPEDLGLTVAGLCGIILVRQRPSKISQQFLNLPGIHSAT